jgi:hypothetical protein
MTKVTIPDWGKGLNRDLLASELGQGWCSNAVNFRFRNGFAEKWEGLDSATSIASLSVSWIQNYLVGDYSYAVMAGDYGGAGGKVYAFNQATASSTEITRYTVERDIVTITRIGANTAEVSTSPNHDLSTGDVITLFGATESGYNVSRATITVMSAAAFRYTTTTAIAANATAVGKYVVYSAVGTTVFFSINPSVKWTGGSFQGLLIVNHPANGLYYWGGTDKLRKPEVLSYQADVARPFKNYIIQLAPTISSTKYRRRVLWSSAAEPGAMPTSFEASATNDAGFQDLADSNAVVIDCLPLGDVNIVYTEDARYAMQYIGGEFVFAFTRLPGSDGMFTQSCVVDTPVGHVFLTGDLDVKVHAGGEARSIASGRVRDYLKSVTATTPVGKGQAFLASNPAKSEVWVCTTSTGTGCDKVLVWNWTSDTWTTFDAAANPLICGTNALFPRRTGVNATDTILVGSGTNLAVPGTTGVLLGSAITGTLERTGMDFGDRDTFSAIQRSRWNIDGTAGNTASIYHGSSKTADGSVTYASAATYTIGTTDYANARATSGRFGAVKLTTTAYPFSVRSCDLDVTGGGKR